MRILTCFSAIVFVLFSLSCKKKKAEEKIEGVWYVNTLANKYYSAENLGTCEFKTGGTGAFDITFFNKQSNQQVVNKDTFKWTNTKNTLTLHIDSNGERLYFKIEHLSAKMLRINSGDYTYGIMIMNR